MTALNSPAPGRLTSQDLIRLKKHLADNLMRALESEGIAVDHDLGNIIIIQQ